MARAAGRFDVDRMLDEIEPGVFEEFYALELLEPSNPWEHTGTIAAAAHNANCVIGNKARKAEDYIPRPVFQARNSRELTGDRLAAVEAYFKRRYSKR